MKLILILSRPISSCRANLPVGAVRLGAKGPSGSCLTLYIQKEKRGRRCPGVPEPLVWATEYCNRDNDCYRSRFATLAFVLGPLSPRLDAEEWELVKRILRGPEIKNV